MHSAVRITAASFHAIRMLDFMPCARDRLGCPTIRATLSYDLDKKMATRVVEMTSGVCIMLRYGRGRCSHGPWWLCSSLLELVMHGNDLTSSYSSPIRCQTWYGAGFDSCTSYRAGRGAGVEQPRYPDCLTGIVIACAGSAARESVSNKYDTAITVEADKYTLGRSRQGN